MSERKLREVAKGYWQLLDGLGVLGFHGGEETAWVVEEIERQLADPPDVAKLARKLAQLMQQYQDDLDASKKPRYRIEEVGNRGYKEGVVGTLRETIDLITDLFHVRLTNDGGWEWTDETG